MLKRKMINPSSQNRPSYAYVSVVHDYNEYDKLFFCDEHQKFLMQVPWLIMRKDNYFVPSLFLLPSFDQELSKLFPDKETVFHHLGRYLFHPTNRVWGLITRYYESYLATADERIGLQVRTFYSGPGPFQFVMDQILGCTRKEKLLPDIVRGKESQSIPAKPQKSKYVLVTSLKSGYAENLRNMYWEHPTSTEELIGVYQPSLEEEQQTGKQLHNMKTWAEMYLLSLTDVMVTSAQSTFGYVAQGLGGLKPWILYKSENETTPEPACGRAMSMEPCFHAPPFLDCKTMKCSDTRATVNHVRRCQDLSWGVKLVNGDDDHEL